MDALRDIKFKSNEGGGDNPFLKFQTDVPVKLRVFTTNPTVHLNQWGKEQFSFAVWNWDEDKAMILSKGASIARVLHQLHLDEDFGADITQVDIKITPTGEKLDREYAVNVLPKSKQLTDAMVEELTKLDNSLDKILKGSIRADEYNKGIQPPAPLTGMDELDPASLPDESIDLTEVFPEEDK